MQRAVEERERRALARAVQRGAAREAIAPLHVGRRQRPQGARHLGRAQVRQVPRLEGAEPRRGGIGRRCGLGLGHGHSATMATEFPHA